MLRQSRTANIHLCVMKGSPGTCQPPPILKCSLVCIEQENSKDKYFEYKFTDAQFWKKTVRNMDLETSSC